MCEDRTKRYFKAIAWFSALWGIKEFILEPLVKKAKDDKKQHTKYKQAKAKLVNSP